MKKIGLTGGIGSGKSYIAKQFEALGVPVYYSDKEAKELMISDKDIIQDIKREFGDKSYHKDGSLNKPHLAGIIFNDAHKRDSINKIVHPRVKNHFEKWSLLQTAPYCLKEAAIIFETNSQSELDSILTVISDMDLRVKRTIKRDGTNRKTVFSKMKAQFSDFQRLQLTNFVIFNDRDTDLKRQILHIHKKLNELCRTSSIL